MPGYTDTASAPNVFLGMEGINGIVSIGSAGAQYLYASANTTREVRGLADTTAIACATYWSAQANTSAIVQRVSEAGLYNVVISVRTESLTPDT